VGGVAALCHRKLLLIAEAEEAAEREPQYAPTDASRTAQDVHLARLSACLKSPQSNHRPERPAFESDTGRSALAPGTAESAPEPSSSRARRPTVFVGSCRSLALRVPEMCQKRTCGANHSGFATIVRKIRVPAAGHRLNLLQVIAATK
jgi:hypothetical protein